MSFAYTLKERSQYFRMDSRIVFGTSKRWLFITSINLLELEVQNKATRAKQAASTRKQNKAHQTEAALNKTCVIPSERGIGQAKTKMELYNAKIEQLEPSLEALSYEGYWNTSSMKMASKVMKESKGVAWCPLCFVFFCHVRNAEWLVSRFRLTWAHVGWPVSHHACYETIDSRDTAGLTTEYSPTQSK